MGSRTQSVVSLDPIDRQKELGFFGKLLVTRYAGGKPVRKTEPFGHYMFCGKQRGGKTASVLWYAEKLNKRYKKKKLTYEVHDGCEHSEGIFKCTYKKFDEYPTVKLYSNFGVGKQFNKEQVFDLIDKLDPYANEVRIVLIDEIHTYFNKNSTDKKTSQIITDMNTVFSQLAKRNCYVLSTAQVYGRLDKALREQCLYMVDCKVGLNRKLINEFILESDIMCDDLGRWAGRPRFIWKHGLSKIRYDTKKLIRE